MKTIHYWKDPPRVLCENCGLSCAASLLINKTEVKCPCLDCFIKPVCSICCDGLVKFSYKIDDLQVYIKV